MSDILELVGQRALVTGGTKGIGKAVASRLRELGATVLITARTRPDELPPGNLFVAADVASPEGCAAVANAVTEQLGSIDIVVHVVGGSSAPGGGFDRMGRHKRSRDSVTCHYASCRAAYRGGCPSCESGADEVLYRGLAVGLS